MKSFIRFLALLLFAASLAVSLVATWTTNNIHDEDGFMAATAAIGASEEVRTQVVNVASVQLAANTGFGPRMSARIAEATADVFLQNVDGSEFQGAWRESMRRTHRSYFGANPPEGIVVDLAPFLDAAVEDSPFLSRLRVVAPEQLPVRAAGTDISQAIDLVSTLAKYRVLSYGAALVAALIALVATPRRQLGSTIALLGGTTLGVVLIAALIVRRASAFLVDTLLSDHRDFASIIRPIGSMLVESVDTMLVPVAVGGLAVAAAGILWRALSRRQK